MTLICFSALVLPPHDGVGSATNAMQFAKFIAVIATNWCGLISMEFAAKADKHM